MFVRRHERGEVLIKQKTRVLNTLRGIRLVVDARRMIRDGYVQKQGEESSDLSI
jgi:hypothetical protein